MWGGMMEHMVLQNTRLNLVMNMADIIHKSIFRAILNIYRDDKLKWTKKGTL